MTDQQNSENKQKFQFNPNASSFVLNVNAPSFVPGQGFVHQQHQENDVQSGNQNLSPSDVDVKQNKVEENNIKEEKIVKESVVNKYDDEKVSKEKEAEIAALSSKFKRAVYVKGIVFF